MAAITDREKTLRIAERYRARAKYPQAIAELRKVVRSTPGDVQVLNQIAYLQVQIEAFDDAARTLSTIASCLEESGQRLRALAVYRRLWQMVSARIPGAVDQYGFVQAKIESLGGAVREQRTMLNAYAEAAAELEENQRDSDAVEMLKKIVELEPSNPLFHVRLAEAQCRLNRIAPAIDHFRSAAELLADFQCTADAIRVAERILHLKPSARDALLAARLYLERNGPNDAMHAIAKLGMAVDEDAENLDALALLARAFEMAGKPSQALQVQREMARIADERGERELSRDLESILASPDGSSVPSRRAREVSREDTPSVSFRDELASIAEDDLVSPTDEAGSHKDASVSVEGAIDFDDVEVLSDAWVEPLLSRDARRALSEAGTFRSLGLYPKAEVVVRDVLESEPACAELRDELCRILLAAGRRQDYSTEAIALTHIYLERRYPARARALLRDVLHQSPGNETAKQLLTAFLD
jgi:tetratricopeptide (TPR) repeat protein